LPSKDSTNPINFSSASRLAFKNTTDNLAIAMAGISRSTNYTPGI
jgi:hypothetical protein